MTPGRLIRERRRAHGVTQAQLALRARTTQAAISRLERDELSPSWSTVVGVLAALGEEPVLGAHRPELPCEEAHLRASIARPPAERLELALSWNRLAGELAAAGRRAPLR
jgi:transcriptional regulator with XRE-family HTH domain